MRPGLPRVFCSVYTAFCFTDEWSQKTTTKQRAVVRMITEKAPMHKISAKRTTFQTRVVRLHTFTNSFRAAIVWKGKFHPFLYLSRLFTEVMKWHGKHWKKVSKLLLLPGSHNKPIFTKYNPFPVAWVWTTSQAMISSSRNVDCCNYRSMFLWPLLLSCVVIQITVSLVFYLQHERLQENKISCRQEFLQLYISLPQ